MPDIVYQFPIKASAQPIFRAVATPAGLDSWWTLRSAGVPAVGATYELWFGPEYDWRAVVSRCVADREFELEITVAQQDWVGTRVGITLEEQQDFTLVRFCHAQWPERNGHFEGSCYCWAMYLRLLKRYVERGEVVAYDQRDEA